MKKPTNEMLALKLSLKKLKGEHLFEAFISYMDLYSNQLRKDYDNIDASKLVALQNRIKGIQECAHFVDTL